MSLTLSRVTYAYRRGQALAGTALADVSIALHTGRMTLIIGATGSGKSTLLRAAAGLLVPDAGEVQIDGCPLLPDAARGEVGLIFQDAESQLFADTVLEDVEFGPRNMGGSRETARAAAIAALADVGLAAEAFGDRSPFTLSGGEARRAAIAGVLAMRPRYLLADEPTAGLDAAGRRRVRDLLRAQKAHAGVGVVSHASEEFLSDADDVVMMSNGAVAWSGPVAELLADPSLFEVAGLRAPDVLQVQLEARRRGLTVERCTLDPEMAGAALATAGGWI